MYYYLAKSRAFFLGVKVGEYKFLYAWALLMSLLTNSHFAAATELPGASQTGPVLPSIQVSPTSVTSTLYLNLTPAFAGFVANEMYAEAGGNRNAFLTANPTSPNDVAGVLLHASGASSKVLAQAQQMLILGYKVIIDSSGLDGDEKTVAGIQRQLTGGRSFVAKAISITALPNGQGYLFTPIDDISKPAEASKLSTVGITAAGFAMSSAVQTHQQGAKVSLGLNLLQPTASELAAHSFEQASVGFNHYARSAKSWPSTTAFTQGQWQSTDDLCNWDNTWPYTCNETATAHRPIVVDQSIPFYYPYDGLTAWVTRVTDTNPDQNFQCFLVTCDETISWSSTVTTSVTMNAGLSFAFGGLGFDAGYSFDEAHSTTQGWSVTQHLLAGDFCYPIRVADVKWVTNGYWYGYFSYNHTDSWAFWPNAGGWFPNLQWFTWQDHSRTGAWWGDARVNYRVTFWVTRNSTAPYVGQAI